MAKDKSDELEKNVKESQKDASEAKAMDATANKAMKLLQQLRGEVKEAKVKMAKEDD